MELKGIHLSSIDTLNEINARVVRETTMYNQDTIVQNGSQRKPTIHLID